MNIVKDFIEGRKFTLSNVKVEWAYLVKPDKSFNKSIWKITGRLEEAMAMSMLDAGFNVKNTKDGNKFKAGDAEYFFIECTKKTHTKEGKEMTPPDVKDRDGETDVDGSRVGNGSVCNINIFARYTEVNGKTFLPAYLNAVQVLELVMYNPTGFQNVDEPQVSNDPFGA